MTRAARVSIELFAPPLLGSSPFLLMAIITGTFGLIPVVLLVAYLVAIVPSMIFTGLMELAFWRGLEPRSPKAILLAGFLGLAAGVGIGLEHRAHRSVEVRPGSRRRFARAVSPVLPGAAHVVAIVADVVGAGGSHR
jgi:hypothetical protein